MLLINHVEENFLHVQLLDCGCLFNYFHKVDNFSWLIITTVKHVSITKMVDFFVVNKYISCLVHRRLNIDIRDGTS